LQPARDEQRAAAGELQYDREPMVRDRVLQAVRQTFVERFQAPAAGVAVAPGRINLIGEHTDYNDGFVLPMAIDRHVVVAFSPRPDRTLRVFSSDFQQVREISLDALERRLGAGGRRSRRGGWFGYIAGVAWVMLGAGHRLVGADMAIAGDLPLGAGLSSSAALEIAVSRALADLAGLDWEPRPYARLAQRAEHEFAGVACGIMDQLSVAAARAQHALLIDCRSLDLRDVPIPSSARIVVFDSGMPRALAASAYNDRRAACERVVAAMHQRHSWVHALRDADDALLADVAAELDPVDVRRASHVIAENRRPLEMATAFAANDLGRAGRLMMHSHASLRDLYEVSSPELDALVDLAIEQPGCSGARLTGAGFGGCAIALVEAGSVERVLSSVEIGYEQRMGRTTTAFVCQASAGATILPVVV
jgi:galactokinase